MTPAAYQQLQGVDVVRGDDIALACTYQVDEAPASIVGVDIASQVRTTAGALVGTFTVDRTNEAAGQFLLRMPHTATATWPDDMLVMDIRYSVGQQRRHTGLLRLRMSAPATRDA